MLREKKTKKKNGRMKSCASGEDSDMHGQDYRLYHEFVVLF